jgi:hypothetical protein
MVFLNFHDAKNFDLINNTCKQKYENNYISISTLNVCNSAPLFVIVNKARLSEHSLMCKRFCTPYGLAISLFITWTRAEMQNCARSDHMPWG